MKDLSHTWAGQCQRCGKKTSSHTMSWFNTQLICLECSDKERQHPEFFRAVEADHEAMRRGDYNFPGIGYPEN